MDDDPFAHTFIKMVLEPGPGYQVRDVGDVASALIAVESFQPSVVVTDWNLPDGNGGGLARQLRQQSGDLPIILVSGDAADMNAEAFDIDFSTIIKKPFSPSALESAMRLAIGRKPTLSATHP